MVGDVSPTRCAGVAPSLSIHRHQEMINIRSKRKQSSTGEDEAEVQSDSDEDEVNERATTTAPCRLDTKEETPAGEFRGKPRYARPEFIRGMHIPVSVRATCTISRRHCVADATSTTQHPGRGRNTWPAFTSARIFSDVRMLQAGPQHRLCQMRTDNCINPSRRIAHVGDTVL